MTPEARQLELPDGEVVFYPAFFSPSESDGLFQRLLSTTEWRQDVIQMYGKDVNLPRLTAWYGDAGTGYVYSGIENTPRPWTEVLTDVKAAIEPACGVTFNSVLLNRYRTGQDSVSWHSDDEPEFGENPVIGSVSFGGARQFQFRHKKQKDLKQSVELTHGSLLIMRGATQHNWVHQIPKTKRTVPERVNLTFRLVKRLPATGKV